MAAVSRPISSMSNVWLGFVHLEAPPTSEGGPRFFPVKLESVSGEDGGKGSTMDASVHLTPPIGVPSAAVAEIICTHVTRKRATRALSFFSSIEPCPPSAIADATMRPRSGSESWESGRPITIRIRTEVRVSKGISDTR